MKKPSSIGIEHQERSTVELPANDNSTIIDSKSVAKKSGELLQRELQYSVFSLLLGTHDFVN